MKPLLRIVLVIECCFLTLHYAHAQTAERNYLAKEYDSKGGAASLSIDAWRKDKLQSVFEKLRDLPDHDKQTLVDAADKSLQEAWRVFKATDYLKYKVNGNRSEFESMYFARRRKLSKLVIGELMERKGKYIPEIVNGLWLICEESTWALPAHMYLQKMGEGLPDPDEPIVELFTGDTGTMLAWIKFLLKDELNTFSPVIVKRLDDELNKRIAAVFLARSDFWWEGLGERPAKLNNWNIWINTNMLIAASLALDDPGIRTRVIEKAIHSADKFLNGYPEDGGCDEGPSYWRGAGGRLIEFVHLLTAISGDKLRWNDNQLIHNIASYIYKVQIADDWYVDFADAQAQLIPDPWKVCMAGDLFQDERLKAFAAYLYLRLGADKGVPGGDVVNDFINNLELDREMRAVTPKAPMPQGGWLPDLEVLTLRRQQGSRDGLFLGAKAGTNGESHNHNDVGSFIIYTDGQPVLIDPGSVQYTKQTFGPDRYKIWAYTSDWHNCPTINGFPQHDGITFAARDVSYSNKGSESSFTMDLARAYPDSAGINSWKRTLNYDRAKGRISLVERYDLKELKAPFVLNFISAVPASLTARGVAFFKGEDFAGTLYMKFDPDLFEFNQEVRPVDDAVMKNVSKWGKAIYRITLRSRSPSLKGEYTIQFVNGSETLNTK